MDFSVDERLALAGGAYYDMGSDTIHILPPDLLYRLALEHEKAHVRQFKSLGGFRLVLGMILGTAERSAWKSAYKVVSQS